jgi:hypothetical protein
MPANGQKQPRWLMGCKCGAMVKASANRTGTALSAFGAGSERGQGANSVVQ